MKKIIILGAGIGGLTVAHELSKCKNYDIHILERNPIVGGQARSKFINYGDTDSSQKNGNNKENHIDKDDLYSKHSEYCWHAIGCGYVHMLRILNEIKLDNHEEKQLYIKDIKDIEESNIINNEKDEEDEEGIENIENNIDNIEKDIIIEKDENIEKDNNIKTVFDNLIPITSYIYGRDNGSLLIENGNSFITKFSIYETYKIIRNMGKNITLSDLLILLKVYIISTYCCEDRIKSYDNVTWPEYMKNLSPEAKKWVIESTSIYMGMDTTKLSTHTMLDTFRPRKQYQFYKNNIYYLVDRMEELFPSIMTHIKSYNRIYRFIRSISHFPYYLLGYDNTHKNTHFHAFNGPINEKWFDPWKKQLEKRGVKFHMEKEVKNIIIEDGNITRVLYGNNEIIEGDIYINGLDIQSYYNLINKNEGNDKFRIYTNKLEKLNEKSRQIQTQVLFKLESPLDLKSPSLIILPDTKWQLMIRPEGNIWDLENIDLLSVGIGLWDKQGLNGKMAKQCTRHELVLETWNQIISIDGLNKLKTKDGQSLKDICDKTEDISLVPRWNIWSSYQFNEYKGEMDTWEPKFSNGIGTLELRKDIKDDYIKNLLHSTAYTKTETNIFCMESACEAGRRAARCITSNNDNNDEKRITSTFLQRIFRYIDSYIFYYLS